MPANKYGIDVAGLYRDIESTKAARIRNKMADLQLGEAERVVTERPEKERLAKEHQARLTGLRQASTQGDVDAQKQLLAIDTEGGASFIEAVDKMGDRERARVQQQIDEKATMTATILQAQPEKRPALYQQMLSMLPEESLAKMPKEYNENYMELALAKQRAMDNILDVKAVKFGGQNVLVKGGREVERADIPVKKTGGAGAGGGGGLKSGDESLMYKQSVELLNGIFDEKGNITNLDPQTRNTVQAIATEATNIYVKEGNITRSEAVKRAAKKAGIDVKLPETEETDVADPNNIRKYLLN